MEKRVLRGGSDAKSGVERRDCGQWFFPSFLPFPFLGAGFGAPKFRSSEVLVTKREERDG